jgi:hypothetical protein
MGKLDIMQEMYELAKDKLKTDDTIKCYYVQRMGEKPPGNLNHSVSN